MTNEEASIIVGNIPIIPDDCYSIEEYQQAKAMAIGALEKQITKKLIRNGSDKACPSCGETLIEAGYMYTYCDICGQKLDMDWSVEE